MNPTSKLFLLLLSTATIMPMAANPSEKSSQKKSAEAAEETVTLSRDEVSKLHWVGLFTGLWLIKASAPHAYDGFNLILDSYEAANRNYPQESAEKRDRIAKGVMVQGLFYMLLGISATCLGAKLTWFFAMKKIRGTRNNKKKKAVEHKNAITHPTPSTTAA
jgi:hypothetical protein